MIDTRDRRNNGLASERACTYHTLKSYEASRADAPAAASPNPANTTGAAKRTAQNKRPTGTERALAAERAAMRSRWGNRSKIEPRTRPRDNLRNGEETNATLREMGTQGRRKHTGKNSHGTT